MQFLVFVASLALAYASHHHQDGYEYPAPVVSFTVAPPHAHSTISSYSTYQHHDDHVAAAAPVVDVHPHGVDSRYLPPSSYVHTDSAVHSDYGLSAPIVHGVDHVSSHHAEPSAPAHYDFGYSVMDPHTGDIKSQHETRRGDVVTGSYTLADSDGTQRTVHYTADAVHGFNAVVQKDPVTAHVVTAAPLVYTDNHHQDVSHEAHVVTAAPLVYSDGQAVSHHDAVSHYETVTQHGW
ncbi:unnamed protein product [Acanthoscelides obtectus]|uniref:Uncharacterized protein n=1 Tax=Acanthoscelides obtectus TaxID=200917 RepID=A0A9P0NUW8_ACAOB|nr:unnamed protein product [Acanthoscelides obtectus]CAK1642766.1 Cuticle protein [Acanthoscelides obtectus]